MFDESVTSRLQRDHMDAHLTAHFEVPGVMFDLSLEAQAQNRGKVGSTSDILNYIVDEVQATAATHPTKPVTLPFVLGTEAGMITGIVAKVQHVLQELDSKHVEAEIIFPVADSAISVVSADPTNTGADLGIVPGVTAGEGCSAGGGCATCPYMKMNNLDSLLRVVELAAYEAPTLELAPYLIQNKGSVRETQTGVIPINHMRMFQREGAFPTDLVTDITTRNQPTSQ
jgi:quinolinate synthase